MSDIRNGCIRLLSHVADAGLEIYEGAPRLRRGVRSFFSNVYSKISSVPAYIRRYRRPADLNRPRIITETSTASIPNGNLYDDLVRTTNNNSSNNLRGSTLPQNLSQSHNVLPIVRTPHSPLRDNRRASLAGERTPLYQQENRRIHQASGPSRRISSVGPWQDYKDSSPPRILAPMKPARLPPGDHRNQITPSSKKILLENLETYLTTATRSRTLDEEFETFPPGYNKSMTAFKAPYNRNKNRYTNNYVYDDTRVKLTPRENVLGSDYINANFIWNCRKSKAYIATQGPKDFNDNTLIDFWRMIWKYNVDAIVMLASLVEGGKVKVAQYWPQRRYNDMKQEQFTISLLNETKKVDYSIREFDITLGNESRKVKQYQFTAWPDHGVPQTPFSFALMVKDVRDLTEDGHIVVHCSAGIGRTGTFLLVMAFMDQLQRYNYIDPPSALINLRMSRPRLVDNTAQYRFSHQVLLEVMFGHLTSCSIQEFISPSNNSIAVKEDLEKQYQKLKNCAEATYEWGGNPAHAHLNRNQNILPADGRQIFLNITNGVSESQYINAVRVNSVTQQNAMIVTEHPTQQTLGRTWKMLFEKNSPVWVILNQHPDGIDLSSLFPPLLPPKGAKVEFENLSMETESVFEREHFTEAQVLISSQMFNYNRSQPRSLKVLMLKHWPMGCDTPVNIQSLIMLLSYLQDNYEHSSKNPIVFTCSNGVTACGVTSALAIVLTEMKLHNTVSVYRAVRGILRDRPQFITSAAQYVFLHDFLLSYILMRNITIEAENNPPPPLPSRNPRWK